LTQLFRSLNLLVKLHPCSESVENAGKEFPASLVGSSQGEPKESNG